MTAPATPTGISRTDARAKDLVASSPSRTLGTLWRLYRNEMRLFGRESSVLIFVFGFPILTSLILGGVFGTDTDDSGFEYLNPSHFYTVAYFGVVLSAIGLVMLPVRVAGYRERGVLRRFDTSGFARWTFPATQFLAGATFAVLGCVALLVTALVTSGVPSVELGWRVGLGLVASTLAMVSMGVALGMLLPTARAAQGLGLTLFFPMFLLAGGGPPPEALTDGMRTAANALPLTHVIRSIQEPWFGLATGTNHLLVVLAVFAVSTLVWVGRSRYVLAAD